MEWTDIDEKDLVAFVTLVADLRKAQRDYFRTRTADDLAAAKRLERAVDDAVKGFGKPVTRGLFGGDG